jgi:hypothetical protein
MIRGDFFDYDPLTGLTEYYEEQDGKVMIHTYQDVEPYLDYAKAMANEGLTDESWKKTGCTNYAIIPPIVQGLLFKKGINFLDPNHTKAVVDEINTNYPHLKTTHKHHALKR